MVTVPTRGSCVTAVNTKRLIVAPISWVDPVPITGSQYRVTAFNTSAVIAPTPSVTPTSSSTGGSGTAITLAASRLLLAGQPVFVTPASTLDKANANDTPCLGVVVTDAGTGARVSYVSDGSVNNPDWTAIIGSQYLTPGATYYLSSTGMLTRTVPTSGFLQQIGIAVSQTLLDVEIQPPIQLA